MSASATAAPAASSSRRPWPAWSLTVVLAAVYVAWQPATADIAAHEYRAEIARRLGFAVWEQGWYAGHYLPGYSVLVPPLAAVFGPALVAAAGAVGAAWAFERLAREHWPGTPGAVASWWFAAAVFSALVAGQLVFVPGLALALGALVAGSRGRRVAGAVLGALSMLTSPVAAVFLLIACAAWWWASRARAAVVIVVATVLPGLVIALLFPGTGEQGFGTYRFLASTGLTLLTLLALPRRERALRTGAAIALAAMLVAWAVPDPVGSNLQRLPALFAGPVLAGALLPGRRALLSVLAIPALFWQWSPAVESLAVGRGDPSARAAYFAPLLRELRARQAAEGPFRIEIPFTRLHAEAWRVAPHVPLARGWEHQTDRAANGVLYRPADRGWPAAYRRWLDDLAIRYVALADVPLDSTAQTEARLLRAGRIPGLRQVWASRHWRLFEVVGGRPLVTPPARVTELGLSSVGLTSPRPAVVTLRVRWTSYWTVARGAGCVSRAPGGWTRVQLDRRGPARIAVRFDATRARRDGPWCTRGATPRP